MRGAFALLAAAAVAGLPHVALALEANEIFKRADPSIVVISTTDKNGKDLALGSGVLLTPRDVVTNCHVLKDAVGIAVKQPGVQRSAKLRYQDTARDLCQVLLDDALPAGKPVTSLLPSAKLEVGQQVYAIGAPQGLDRTLSRGIISALRDMKENAKLIQTDASIAKGSSGGGLFDSEGRLIGIVTFGIEEGNLNFAIPTDWIEQLAARNRDRSTDAVPTGPSATSTAAPAADGRWYPAKGDRWNYRLLDGKRPVGTVSVEVTDASNGRVRERITKSDSSAYTFERDVTAEFDAHSFAPHVALPGGFQFIDLSAYLPPGVQIEQAQLTSPIAGQVRINQMGVRSLTWSVRLAGRERVKVPAGEFEAWKIEAASSTNMQHGVVQLRYSVWYSAESRRAVKIYFASLWPIHTQSSFETLEMVNQPKDGR